MPLLWIPFARIQPSTGSADLLSAPYQAKPDKRIQVAPDLVVTAESSVFDPLTTTYTFRRGVVATYGPTVVRAQMLVIHAAPGEERAEAAGSVQLEDPAGMISADDLKFSWKKDARTATAENAMIQIANVMLTARHVDMTPERWDLYDVVATNCHEPRPVYEIHSHHLIVRPGHDGTLEKPTVYVLGQRIVTLPRQSFNLNPRTEGFQYPSFTYRKGAGFGVAFASGFLLAPQTNLNVNYSTFPQSLPGYAATVTQSLVPDAKEAAIITPGSDFNERFRFGYLEDIKVPSDSQEDRSLRTLRQSVSLDTGWNSFISDRGPGLPYSKPIEGVYELGGPVGNFGYIAQARLQTIQENGGPVHTRGVLVGSLGPQPLPVARNLSAIARCDTNLFVGNDYGWVRGIAGLVYHPWGPLTVAGGAFVSRDFGTPLFDIDPLLATDGYVIRADLNLGPTKISYMTKYDRNLGWFDREYTIHQVVGCLEPFLESRRQPESYNIGVLVRLDNFYDILRHRDFQRNLPGREVVVSPAPDGG